MAINEEVQPRVLHPIPETAFLLGISQRQVHYMIARREIKSVRVGRKRRLVPRSEIDRIARQAR
jgi:excisionase family DNA binding protein